MIRGRFGTGGRPAKSIRDVARDLGVTQKNAAKLEASALRRLSADNALAGFRSAA